MALLLSGRLDQLSLLKEYANRQEVFQAAGLRHLQIVGATLLPSLLIGVPLGVLAARRGRVARPLFALKVRSAHTGASGARRRWA